MTSHPILAAFLLFLASTAGLAAQKPDIPHEDPQPAPGHVLSGAQGSPVVVWTYPSAPPDGFDGIRASIRPVAYAGGEKNFIYWAFQVSFQHGAPMYMGLQPNGSFPEGTGKMALFSVFGPGTSSSSPDCTTGADGGEGTSCHLHYAWAPERSYEFTVTLIRQDSRANLWQGAVYDPVAKVRTVIGEISIDSSRGLIAAAGQVNFDEFYVAVPCPKQPQSQATFFRPTGFRDGTAYPAMFQSARNNAGCNPVFFGDGKTYATVTVGGR